MKEIIKYYYNFDVDTVIDFKNGTAFKYNGEDFYFVFFNRTMEELDDLIAIITELKNKGIRVHDIILNRENKLLTKVGDNNYILLKLNTKHNEVISFVFITELSNKLKLNQKKVIYIVIIGQNYGVVKLIILNIK